MFSIMFRIPSYDNQVCIPCLWLECLTMTPFVDYFISLSLLCLLCMQWAAVTYCLLKNPIWIHWYLHIMLPQGWPSSEFTLLSFTSISVHKCHSHSHKPILFPHWIWCWGSHVMIWRRLHIGFAYAGTSDSGGSALRACCPCSYAVPIHTCHSQCHALFPFPHWIWYDDHDLDAEACIHWHWPILACVTMTPFIDYFILLSDTSDSVQWALVTSVAFLVIIIQRGNSVCKWEQHVWTEAAWKHAWAHPSTLRRDHSLCGVEPILHWWTKALHPTGGLILSWWLIQLTSIGFSAGVWYDRIDAITDWHSATPKQGMTRPYNVFQEL
jgi:hypothetical protein